MSERQTLSLLTNLVPDTFISQCTRRSFAEKYSPPLSSLCQFQAFVVDLVGQFPRRGNNDSPNTCADLVPC